MDKKEAKVKLSPRERETVLAVYNGVEFTVIPFLGYAQQIVLIQNYVEEYFGNPNEGFVKESEYNYIEAESNLINYICQLLTNIDTDELRTNVNIYSDPVFVNLLFDSIDNYVEFRDKLERIIWEIKEQNVLHNSVGYILADVVEKAYEFLNNISNASPEEIAKMQKETESLLKKLEDSSILNNALYENNLKETEK